MQIEIQNSKILNIEILADILKLKFQADDYLSSVEKRVFTDSNSDEDDIFFSIDVLVEFRHLITIVISVMREEIAIVMNSELFKYDTINSLKIDEIYLHAKTLL